MARSKKPEGPALLTQAQLKAKTLETMEDELRIKPRQAQDFIDSMKAVIEEAVGEGRPVAVFGIVKLNTGFKLARPRRKGTDPRTGEETTFKARPASVSIRATIGKAIKDALPKASSGAGKSLQAVQEHRAKEAAKRAKEREKADK